MPQTLRIAMTDGRYPPVPRMGTPREALEVLPGADPFDGATAGGLLALRQQRADIDNALALLARDLGPVVGVGGVGEVFVLLVLLLDGSEEVLGADALTLARDRPLDGELLGPAHDVLDHGARREVLEVEDLLVAVLVGDLEEAVLLVVAVHLDDRAVDHGVDRLAPVAAAEALDLVFVVGQVFLQVAAEDLPRRRL